MKRKPKWRVYWGRFRHWIGSVCWFKHDWDHHSAYTYHCSRCGMWKSGSR